MKTEAFYRDLIQQLRCLVQVFEAVGCAGFDLSRSAVLTETDAFQIATGVDRCIVALNAAISSCRHALDILAGLPYVEPMTDKENKIIECAAEIVSIVNCSTPQNGP